MKVIFAVLSIFTWTEILIGFIVFIPFQFLLFLLTVLFDKKRILLHYHSSCLSTIVLFLSPVLRVKIKGREYLDRSKSHVIVMNHQSLLDILLAYRLFYPVKMIGKKVLAKVPIIGWNMLMSGHLLVDRMNRTSQFEAIRKMDSLLRKGDSMLIFPEGTRTRNGEIGPFRKGAFRSAVNTGTPLLPVVLDGAYQALPKGRLFADSVYTLTLTVLNPIPVEKGETMTELADKCRNVMIRELERSRNS